jgi:hypothetical protein
VSLQVDEVVLQVVQNAANSLSSEESPSSVNVS